MTDHHQLIPTSSGIDQDEDSGAISTTLGNMVAGKLSSTAHKILVAAFLLYSTIVGYIVAVQPAGSGWRYFSWHPFLMVLGFIGMTGTAAVTKKLGGYKNTKLHGILASLGVFMAAGGLYVIYHNKEIHGKEHLSSTHAIFGVVTMAGVIMVMLAGGIFLHPDFGVDKTNSTIRFAHKWFSRSVMLLAWVTCYLGLRKHLTDEPAIMALFIVPLVVFAPMTLI
mmetsp:Transcript_12053/g.14945  ORF Transcript_12053/g.14945 Transcript_12053/m.14945 type:complete len:223 (-) Transcript_12053:1626-2294(-)